MTNLPELRTCKVCHIAKRLDQDTFGRANDGRSWQSHCRECGAERSRQHRIAKKDEHVAYDANRRAANALSGARPSFSDADKLAAWSRNNGICLCCAKPITEPLTDTSIDHIVAVSRGGDARTSNLALAHRRCNTDKKDKSLEQHWQWRVNTGKDAVLLSRLALSQIIATAGLAFQEKR